MGKVICFSNTFWESYNKLGKKEQSRVTKAMDELRRNYTSPSLNVHGVEGGKCDKKFLSARVNLDLRIIFVYRDSMCTLLYVGHHDDAYDWCNGKYLEKTNFGDEYIYDRILEQKKIEYVEKTKETEKSRNPKEGIFSHLSISKVDLTELGVQKIHAENLMILEEDELLDYIEIFPHRLQETLIDIVTKTKTYDEAKRTLYEKDEPSQDLRSEFVTMDIDEFESTIEMLSNEIRRQSQSVEDSLKTVSSYDERIKNIEERFKKIESDSAAEVNDYSNKQRNNIIENYVIDSNPNMVLCSKCNKEIYVKAQFCVHCGCMMSEIIADYEKKETEKRERLRREYVSRLSEFERAVYDAPNCMPEVENGNDFSDLELTFVRTHFSDVDKRNFYYFYLFLAKLTSQSLIKWAVYDTTEKLRSLSQMYYTKVCGTGIALEVLSTYNCLGRYKVDLTFRIQDSITFKLGEGISSSDVKILKIINSIYPQYSVLTAIIEKSKKCKREYIFSLSEIEKKLYFMDSTKEILEQKIQENNISLGEKEIKFIQENMFVDENNEEFLEGLLFSLSKECFINWHEFSVEKTDNGCEGIYLSKINDSGVIAKISMNYIDEKKASLKCTYAFQKINYRLGDEHKVKNVKEIRDAIKAATDSFTLTKQMKEFIEERKGRSEAERLMQEKLAKKRALEERLAAIPRLDIYSIFETHDIPGLQSLSLYELYFKDRKMFENIIRNQVVIVDNEALYYLKGLDNRNFSIRQKMYGIDNPIVAQLERHGINEFVVPDSVIQKALDNGYVELITGTLYSNPGWEYYKILYGIKEIKSTVGIAGGGRGKWKGSVIESSANDRV